MCEQNWRRCVKRERFFQIPNATKSPAKRELAIKWLHNIGTGHNVDRFFFVIGKSFAKITSQNNPSKRMCNIDCWACQNDNF